MTKKKTTVFIIKFISIILCVSLIMIVLNHFYINGAYYTDVYGEVESMQGIPEHLKMVNVGTSHGLACFRYGEEETEKFNLALSGSDLYHNFATLKQFKDRFDSGCIIAIPVSYFSFCMPTDEPSQKRYYLFLDREYIKDFNLETYLNIKYFPVLRSGEFIIKDLIKDQEKDIGGMMMDDEDVVVDSPAAAVDNNQPASAFNEQKHQELATHAKGRANSWRSGFFVTGQGYINENKQILVDMINWCRENGFKPLLISPPVYISLNEAFTDEELKSNYFDILNDIAKSTKTPLLGLSHDNVLSFVPDYYRNSDHMSEAGSKEFMKVYYDYLTEIGYTD